METEALYGKIVEGAGDAIVLADRDGRIRVWNAGAEDVFGYAETEALGESLDLIVPEQFRDRHWEGFEAAVARGRTTYDRGELLSVPAVRRDGERISVEFTVTMVEGDDGDPFGVAAIVRDVTERWEARQEREERIRDLEARIEQLDANGDE